MPEGKQAKTNVKTNKQPRQQLQENNEFGKNNTLQSMFFVSWTCFSNTDNVTDLFQIR